MYLQLIDIFTVTEMLFLREYTCVYRVCHTHKIQSHTHTHTHTHTLYTYIYIYIYIYIYLCINCNTVKSANFHVLVDDGTEIMTLIYGTYDRKPQQFVGHRTYSPHPQQYWRPSTAPATMQQQAVHRTAEGWPKGKEGQVRLSTYVWRKCDAPLCRTKAFPGTIPYLKTFTLIWSPPRTLKLGWCYFFQPAYIRVRICVL
jgi:hypothetical protein